MSGDGAIVINEAISIPRQELYFRATRAGGPGGQHVNTSSTRIELLWNVGATQALDEAQRARVREKLATRIDTSGVLRVVASQSRSQAQNRDLAEARLAELVRRALVVPKRRKRSKPSRAAREARLQEKRQRSEKKARRRRKPELD